MTDHLDYDSLRADTVRQVANHPGDTSRPLTA